MNTRVAAAEKEQAEQIALAQENFARCQSRMAALSEETCGETWRNLNAQSIEKLKQCEKTEADMVTCKAEKEVLRGAASGELCKGVAAEKPAGSAPGSEPVDAAAASSGQTEAA